MKKAHGWETREHKLQIGAKEKNKYKILVESNCFPHITVTAIILPSTFMSSAHLSIFLFVCHLSFFRLPVSVYLFGMASCAVFVCREEKKGEYDEKSWCSTNSNEVRLMPGVRMNPANEVALELN